MLRTSGTLVIAAMLFGAQPAVAGQLGEVPVAERAPAGTETATPTPTPTDTPIDSHSPPPTSDSSWLDTGHAAFSEGLFWPVTSFDRFFADQREVEPPRARSFIRWRNQVRFETDGSVAFGTSLRADLRFPYLSHRLKRFRLTLEGESPELTRDQLPSGEPPPPPTTSGRLSAALRLDLLESLLTQADLQAGLLLRLPVGLFTRLRLRHVQPVDDLFQIRTSSAGFWQTTTGWGVRQDADLERPFGQSLLLRLANDATVTQKSRGLEWLSELSLQRTLGERAALSVSGSAAGASDAGPVVERYRLATRLRWQAYRSWLFLELEPEGTWTRPVGGGRQRVLAVILRAEVQFQEGARPPP